MLHSAIVAAPTTGRRSDTVVHHQSVYQQGGSVSVSDSDSVSISDPDASVSQLLKTKLSASLRELATVAMYFDLNFRERLVRQFKHLFNEDDWDVDDELIDDGAVRTLVRTLVLLEPKQRPMLALGGSGSISAIWGEDESRLILECFKNDRLKWYFYSPNPDGGDSAAGNTSVSQLPPLVNALTARPMIDGQG